MGSWNGFRSRTRRVAKIIRMTGAATLRMRIESERAGMSREYMFKAYAWLLEQDKIDAQQEEDRYQTIRWWTIMAAIGGGVAAIAGLSLPLQESLRYGRSKLAVPKWIG
jgi:hypothetical protein